MILHSWKATLNHHNTMLHASITVTCTSSEAAALESTKHAQRLATQDRRYKIVRNLVIKTMHNGTPEWQFLVLLQTLQCQVPRQGLSEFPGACGTGTLKCLWDQEQLPILPSCWSSPCTPHTPVGHASLCRKTLHLQEYSIEWMCQAPVKSFTSQDYRERKFAMR